MGKSRLPMENEKGGKWHLKETRAHLFTFHLIPFTKKHLNMQGSPEALTTGLNLPPLCFIFVKKRFLNK